MLITVENHFLIDPDENGQRLDQIQARRFPRFGRSDWQRRIREGDVQVDGATARPSRRVQSGQTVHYRFQRAPEPEVSREYKILYEDEWLYAVEKPADLPVHPSGIYNDNTLTTLLKQDRGEDTPIYLVHRLDRETSGVLLIAKSGDVARDLQNAFQDKDQARAVQKIYRVAVECPQAAFPEELDASGWIYSAGAGPVLKKRSFTHTSERPADSQLLKADRNGDAPPPPQTARTDFRLLESRTVNSERIALLEARLYTGRMHQIRATLCSLGYPVIGDRLYGVDEALYIKMINDEETPADRQRLRIGRTALHAARLTLDHPRIPEQALTIESALPADIAGVFREDQQHPG